MAEKRLKTMRVAILVTDGFEQVEMTEPRKALENEGAETVLMAPKRGEVQGFHHDEKGDRFPVDQSLDEAGASDFDAVVLPGGVINADKLRIDKRAQDFVRRISHTGKPIAVICQGPWLLISAGLVRGRTLTSYETIQDDIRNAGGHWVDREVARDGLLVSSRKPGDLPAFAEAMIRTFMEAREARQRQEAIPEQRPESRR